MIAWVAIGAAVGALVLRWALARAFTSARVTRMSPTPEEARIRLEADKEIAQAKEDADAQRKRVEAASGSDLYALARERLQRKD